MNLATQIVLLLYCSIFYFIIFFKILFHAGQVITKSVMIDIVKWCRENSICLMADEVYQENLWENDKFTSFRQIAFEQNCFDEKENPSLQLISFHSISKGFLGECGLRGGYFELLGIPDNVKQELYKLASISLCSNTIGQIATGLMVSNIT